MLDFHKNSNFFFYQCDHCLCILYMFPYENLFDNDSAYTCYVYLLCILVMYTLNVIIVLLYQGSLKIKKP